MIVYFSHGRFISCFIYKCLVSFSTIMQNVWRELKSTLSEQKSQQILRILGRSENKGRGKQIEFNKNRSPEANYFGRELDKLFVATQSSDFCFASFFSFFEAIVRRNETENNWLKHSFPKDASDKMVCFGIFLKKDSLNLQQNNIFYVQVNQTKKRNQKIWNINKLKKEFYFRTYCLHWNAAFDGTCWWTIDKLKYFWYSSWEKKAHCKCLCRYSQLFLMLLIIFRSNTG